ncbi:hypothetical protein [Parapedobacter lycopersici]|uniref:hypothetical protein n=1 Tax=Parapedobacter lycopersici TaxID=1864939 RepID=UPI00214DB140|nr:hypothetical protein [Parapedobacter lycopersici]
MKNLVTTVITKIVNCLMAAGLLILLLGNLFFLIEIASEAIRIPDIVQWFSVVATIALVGVIYNKIEI